MMRSRIERKEERGKSRLFFHDIDTLSYMEFTEFLGVER